MKETVKTEEKPVTFISIINFSISHRHYLIYDALAPTEYAEFKYHFILYINFFLINFTEETIFFLFLVFYFAKVLLKLSCWKQ